MKTLSIKNPISYLVCSGIKGVENRTWKTDHRGTILIHSSGSQDFAIPWADLFPPDVSEKYRTMYEPDFPHKDSLYQKIFDFDRKWLDFYGVEINDPDIESKLLKAPDFFCHSRSIIGEVDIMDIVRDSDLPFAQPDCYHWILTNPVLYDKPIRDVKGRLRLFDFNL